MPSDLNIILAQLNPTTGAIEHNADKIIHIIQEHQLKNDLIVFPELCLTGYPPEDLLFRKELYFRVDAALRKIKEVVKNCHVIVGHPCLENEKTFNCATLLFKGEFIDHYYKQMLPNFGVFDEQRYFTPGVASTCIFTLNGYTFGLCICEDLWHSAPVDKLISAGAEVIVCINASPFDEKKYPQRIGLMQKYAKQGVSILYVNQIGGQDELVFDGQSLAMNSKGLICARAAAFKEELLAVQFCHSNISGQIAPLMEQDELVYNALMCGLRDYIEKNGFPGVLLGLSGGIDSALTLAIAVDCLGESRVHAVMMPSRYTADISEQDALLQLKAMHVKNYSTLPIEPAFDSFLHTLAPSFAGLAADTTEENLQARIRGVLLLALSNKLGKMVLTTSNKSETAVGYATLYGDMAGGFSVLKDVLKTQVYALARYRNSLSAVIPERVLSRPPTAELAPNQKDQDSLPYYAILDGIIKLYMEANLDADEIILQGYDPQVVKKIIKLIARNEYKRCQASPGVKISRTAFGRDWRYPITSGFTIAK